MTVENLSLFDPSGPLARSTDPPTARQAARISAPGSSDLVRRIRIVVFQFGPVTAFEVADRIRAQTDRWQHDSIRTRVSNAGLKRFDEEGESPGGRAAQRWVVPLAVVDTAAL